MFTSCIYAHLFTKYGDQDEEIKHVTLYFRNLVLKGTFIYYYQFSQNVEPEKKQENFQLFVFVVK